MKSNIRTLVTAAFLLASATASASAQPVAFQAVIRAELQAVNSERFIDGQLFFDGRQGKIELSLQPTMPPCPEGSVCAQVLPDPVTYSLEGAVSTVDSCGIIESVASYDKRPSDGSFLKVTIRYNQNNHCPTFVALPALGVSVEQSTYNRLEGCEVSTLDTFQAEDVALIKPAS